MGNDHIDKYQVVEKKFHEIQVAGELAGLQSQMFELQNQLQSFFQYSGISHVRIEHQLREQTIKMEEIQKTVDKIDKINETAFNTNNCLKSTTNFLWCLKQLILGLWSLMKLILRVSQIIPSLFAQTPLYRIPVVGSMLWLFVHLLNISIMRYILLYTLISLGASREVADARIKSCVREFSRLATKTIFTICQHALKEVDITSIPMQVIAGVRDTNEFIELQDHFQQYTTEVKNHIYSGITRYIIDSGNQLTSEYLSVSTFYKAVGLSGGGEYEDHSFPDRDLGDVLEPDVVPFLIDQKQEMQDAKFLCQFLRVQLHHLNLWIVLSTQAAHLPIRSTSFPRLLTSRPRTTQDKRSSRTTQDKRSSRTSQDKRSSRTSQNKRSSRTSQNKRSSRTSQNKRSSRTTEYGSKKNGS